MPKPKPLPAKRDLFSRDQVALGLKRLGLDPFAILAAFARDDSDRDRQLKAAIELAQYLVPKLKPGDVVDESQDETAPMVIAPPKALVINMVRAPTRDGVPAQEDDASERMREFAKRQAEPLPPLPLPGRSA